MTLLVCADRRLLLERHADLVKPFEQHLFMKVVNVEVIDQSLRVAHCLLRQIDGQLVAGIASARRKARLSAIRAA